MDGIHDMGGMQGFGHVQQLTAAPPFAEPWESQAFGVALALNDAGCIDWEDFRLSLIREIGDWEAAHPSGESWNYYECWLRSLEQAVSSAGLVDAGDLRARLAALASRPSGHDHEPHDQA